MNAGVLSTSVAMTPGELEAGVWWTDQLAPHIPQSIADWAETHIVVPTGPLAGKPYRHSNHPVSRHWFDALDSRQWQRYAISGPGQCGKSLMGFVIPVLYTLFELGETVFVGIPDMKLANDKWGVDFLPVIQSSFSKMMPTHGEGSRGGAVKSAVTFTNSSRFKFLSAGTEVAGPTTRNLVMTEVDKYDTAGEVSREADPVTQMEARTNAWRDFGRRIILECTVSIGTGRIWQEITKGTDSRLAHQCPHCQRFQTWERENLRGWEAAKDIFEAGEAAYWLCPACDEHISDAQRREMWSTGVLYHRDQRIDNAGKVSGPVPRTDTFGFRWSAFCSPFKSTATLGGQEWRASKAQAKDAVEREMRQFFWCLPYDPPEVELTPLDVEELRQRVVQLKKGEVPADCVAIVVGIDTGKRRLHWTAQAVRPDGSRVIIDYGEQPANADKLGTHRALIEALTKLKAYFDAGWRTHEGKQWTPSQVWIDSGYSEHRSGVYAFCQAANKGIKVGSEWYRPMKGHGEGQKFNTRYTAPRSLGKEVLYVGREFHFTWRHAEQVLLVHVNSDRWKSELHQRLAMPASEPGSLTLYDAASDVEHDEISDHFVAEVQKEQFIPGRGMAVVWERVNRENHYLDAAYAALAAGHFVLAEQERQRLEPSGKRPVVVNRGRSRPRGY